jgi:hypothetical protein
VIRIMRSDIDLKSALSHSDRVVVHGVGKKLGVTRDLTPEERGAIDRAIGGYLADLEDAYQAGLRDDYPIFPAGRLKVGGQNAVREVSPNQARPAVRNQQSRTSQSVRAPSQISFMPLSGSPESIRCPAAGGTASAGRRPMSTRTTRPTSGCSTTRPAIGAPTPGGRSTRRSDGEEVRGRSATTRRRVRSAAFGRALQPTRPGGPAVPIEDSEVRSEDDPEGHTKGSKSGST